MGALVTLELPERSPVADLPWIITVGPLDEDDDWEPVVCGPYERPHALALAEAVVADEELMAVVEPLLPKESVEEIRDEIFQARRGADEQPAMVDDDDDDGEDDGEDEAGESYPRIPPGPDEVRAGFARIASRLTGPR